MFTFHKEEIDHIKLKVDLLNDWHNTVNNRMTKIEETLDWLTWGIKLIVSLVGGVLLTEIGNALHLFH